ncbi:MAG: hypothetical protein RI549_00325 [Wenzhouxiangella sp.]|nr:hypothetical protein [Wenzhouxiangella sp.]
MTTTHAKAWASLLVVFLGGVMAGESHAACADPEASARSFFLSADARRDDLLAVPGVAVGGSGELDSFVIQQATRTGYRSLTLAADGAQNDTQNHGIDVVSSSAQIEQGQAQFRACTEQGFLVFAIYVNDQGEVAGAPADALGAGFDNNYANITPQSNARFGLNFNAQGADETRAIIERQLGRDGVPRLVAELVLTDNVASVFDFAESQAPVYGFDGADCRVVDRQIIHESGSDCAGQVNPAVQTIERLDDGEWVAVFERGLADAFRSQPGMIYRASIGPDGQARETTFVSTRQDRPSRTLSSDPLAPSALAFDLGENVVQGQVDNPRNTRDIFTFAVPEGAQLTGVFLAEWSAGIDQGYVFIDDGDTTVVASAETAGDFLGGAHVSSSLYAPGDNLLDFLAIALQGGVGFDAPLGPGQYSFTMQQTGSVPSRYALKFVIE